MFSRNPFVFVCVCYAQVYSQCRTCNLASNRQRLCLQPPAMVGVFLRLALLHTQAIFCAVLERDFDVGHGTASSIQVTAGSVTIMLACMVESYRLVECVILGVVWPLQSIGFGRASSLAFILLPSLLCGFNVGGFSMQ